MNPLLRQSLLGLHRWLGLVAGVVLVMVAVSGGVLLFRGKLERRLDPAHFVVEASPQRRPVDELVAQAKAAHPVGTVESVRFFADPTAPVLVYFSNRDYVYLNPGTGAVLGSRPRYGSGFGWVESVHRFLAFSPGNGETIAGIFALVFAGIFLLGLVLWWPAAGRTLKAALTFPRGAGGRARLLGIHKTLGAYAALVLITSALTGACMGLDFMRNAVLAVTFSKRVPPPTATGSSGFAGYDPIVKQLAALLPGAREVYLPKPGRGLVTVYAIAADAPHPCARSYFFFDAATSRLLRQSPYAELPRGLRAFYTMQAWHTGVLGGWPAQLLLLTSVLAVPVLAYSGVVSFLRRKTPAT